jgi:hypothetical protein
MAVALAGGVAATQSSTTITLTRTTAAGSLLVLGVQRPASTVSSISDTASNVWVPVLTSGASGITGDSLVDMYYVANAASVTSVTVTMSTTDNANASLMEFTGADTVDPLVCWVTVSTASTSLNMQTTGGTFSQVGPLSGWSASSTLTGVAIGFGGYTSTTSGTRLETNVAGFTTGTQTLNGTHILCVEYKLVPVSTSVTVTAGWTLSSARANGMIYAVFKSPQTTSPVTFALGKEPTVAAAGSTIGSWLNVGYQTTETWTAATGDAYRIYTLPQRGQLWPRGTKGNGNFYS